MILSLSWQSTLGTGLFSAGKENAVVEQIRQRKGQLINGISQDTYP